MRRTPMVALAAGLALLVLGATASAGGRQEVPTLKVSVSGSGHVSSSPAGISCPGDCSQAYADRQTVSLKASPSSGWVFAGWGGDCSGTGGCKVVMSANRSVKATFRQSGTPPPTPPPASTFTLTVAVTGDGSVTSSPAGISCGTDCTESYGQGAVVTLAPSPGAGSDFTSWGGACSGAGICTVTMSSARSVTARFSPRKPAPPETRPAPGSGDAVPATAHLPLHFSLPFLCYSRNDLFLARLYHDVLKRPVDQAALGTYGPKLDSGATARTDVALAVLRSLEYRTMLVGSFYTKLLHRAAIPAEVTFGLGLLASGATDESIEATIIGSAEYLAARGGGTTNGFIDALFQDVLGRGPTAAELTFFGNAIGSGTPRDQVAAEVLASAEARTILVKSYYGAYLHRAPTAAELAAALGRLSSGATDETVAAGILGSADYLGLVGAYGATMRWGDGSSSRGSVAGAGRRCTATATHIYAGTGGHVIRVDIVAPDGTPTTLGRPVNVGSTPPPPPGKENVQPTGKVLIKIGGRFVPLAGFRQVPFGTELDTARGKVKLTSHDGSTASFYQGRFRLVQGLDTNAGRTKRVITIVLTGGSFSGCPKARTTSGVGAKPKPKSRRHVWGDAKGAFRTKGRYASATVRGTLWRTDDLCGGTLVTVKRGRVDVFDLVKRRHFSVPAGRSHLALR